MMDISLKQTRHGLAIGALVKRAQISGAEKFVKPEGRRNKDMNHAYDGSSRHIADILTLIGHPVHFHLLKESWFLFFCFLLEKSNNLISVLCLRIYFII